MFGIQIMTPLLLLAAPPVPLLLLLWLLPQAAGPARATRCFALWLLVGAVVFLMLSYLATNMQAARHIQTSAHRLAWHWLPALAWLVAQLRAGEAPEAVPAESAAP